LSGDNADLGGGFKVVESSAEQGQRHRFAFWTKNYGLAAYVQRHGGVVTQKRRGKGVKVESDRSFIDWSGEYYPTCCCQNDQVVQILIDMPEG
jgi:hypothetical protein